MKRLSCGAARNQPSPLRTLNPVPKRNQTATLLIDSQLRNRGWETYRKSGYATSTASRRTKRGSQCCKKPRSADSAPAATNIARNTFTGNGTRRSLDRAKRQIERNKITRTISVTKNGVPGQ